MSPMGMSERLSNLQFTVRESASLPTVALADGSHSLPFRFMTVE